MVKVAEFSVRAKAERADEFRRAFQMMDALVSESYVDDERTVIRFKVECDISKVSIMEKEVPLGAYAGVAYTSTPPL